MSVRKLRCESEILRCCIRFESDFPRYIEKLGPMEIRPSPSKLDTQIEAIPSR